MAVEEPVIAMACAETNPSTLSLQPNSSSSAIVTQLRLAPVAIQTSGSVVRNSMTLLPAAEGIVKIRAARDSQVKSSFPAALAVDNAGPPSEARDASEEHGRHPTSKVDNASEDEQGMQLVSNAPTEGSVVCIKSGDAHDSQEDCTGADSKHTDSAIVEVGSEDTRVGAVGAISCDSGHKEGQGDLPPASVDTAGDSISITAATVEPQVGDGNERLRPDREVDQPDDSLFEISLKGGGESLQTENGTGMEPSEPAQLVVGTPEEVILCAGTEGDTGDTAEKRCTLVVKEEAPTAMSPCGEHCEAPKEEADGRSGADAVNREQVDVFLPSEKFTGSKPGYLFKLGDKGLGFYKDGYVDCPTKGKSLTSHRPWNAGPGKDAIRRGPMGPVVKSFTRFKTSRKSDGEAKKTADDSDS